MGNRNDDEDGVENRCCSGEVKLKRKIKEYESELKALNKRRQGSHRFLAVDIQEPRGDRYIFTAFPVSLCVRKREEKEAVIDSGVGKALY